jgi:hypothetical protein
MATFLSRTVDSALRRGNRRAALNQFWPADNNSSQSGTPVGGSSQWVVCDGADLFVGSNNGSYTQVRANDGKLLNTVTVFVPPFAMLSAMSRIFFTVDTNPGALWRIDNSQPGELSVASALVSSSLGAFPQGIAYDGTHIWTANSGSVSLLTPTTILPFTVTTVAGPAGQLTGLAFDGSNMWVAAQAGGTLSKMDSAGAVLQTVTVGLGPRFPIFDGTNIWVPNFNSSTISVVRASSGAVLATLTGNGLNGPLVAAFDGQRVLVTEQNGSGVSLWKAADLTPLGFTQIGVASSPFGACSDGLNFWIVLFGEGKLVRF